MILARNTYVAIAEPPFLLIEIISIISINFSKGVRYIFFQRIEKLIYKLGTSVVSCLQLQCLHNSRTYGMAVYVAECLLLPSVWPWNFHIWGVSTVVISLPFHCCPLMREQRLEGQESSPWGVVGLPRRPRVAFLGRRPQFPGR